MAYPVGVDLGQTHAAAALCRGGHAEIVPLAPRAAVVPSVVFVPAVGQWLVGADAERLAPTDPGRVARQFTRRIGDGAPLLVGGIPVTAEALAAHVVSRVLDSVAERVGAPASRVALTHPAGWGAHRLTALRDAMTGNGVGRPVLLSEPEAAVLAHASREPLQPGRAVAVYDLGGAGFAATVVRRDDADRFTPLGRPEELELGGLDFDEVVFQHVTSALGPAWEELDPADPAVLAAVAGLRRQCTAAKEALSADTDVRVRVALPGIRTEVRLGRAEFEEMVRPGIAETVAALERAVGSAGLSAGELAAVLLVGGSARIPLITQTISARLGRPVSMAADPQGIVAIGAALAAHGADAEPTRAIPIPSAPVGQKFPAPPAIRPPLPLAPPPSRRRHTLVSAVAAGVLAVAAVGGLALLTNRTAPVDAGADPVSNQATSTVPHPTEPSVVSGPTEQPAATPTTTTPPRRASNPPRTKRTTETTATTTTPTVTSTATSSPTTTTSTTKAGAR